MILTIQTHVTIENNFKAKKWLFQKQAQFTSPSKRLRYEYSQISLPVSGKQPITNCLKQNNLIIKDIWP